jgi:hypothetical protein
MNRARAGALEDVDAGLLVVGGGTVGREIPTAYK